jgi:hypothetical protein
VQIRALRGIKMKKKHMKTAMGFTTAGIGLGVLGGMDQTGTTGRISRAMPIMGGIYATGMAMDALKGLQKSTKLKKK